MGPPPSCLTKASRECEIGFVSPSAVESRAQSTKDEAHDRGGFEGPITVYDGQAGGGVSIHQGFPQVALQDNR